MRVVIFAANLKKRSHYDRFGPILLIIVVRKLLECWVKQEGCNICCQAIKTLSQGTFRYSFTKYWGANASKVST